MLVIIGELKRERESPSWASTQVDGRWSLFFSVVVETTPGQVTLRHPQEMPLRAGHSHDPLWNSARPGEIVTSLPTSEVECFQTVGDQIVTSSSDKSKLEAWSRPRSDRDSILRGRGLQTPTKEEDKK